MSSRRTIVFLGAPTKEEVMKTWKGKSVPQTNDLASLPPFQISPEHKTAEGEVAWRRLADPIDSLSQELAETTVDIRTPDDFLERSLRIYDEDETDQTNDLTHISDYSELSISQISTPFLTGYDFDVNEITELEDLPSAETVHRHRADNYSLIVAVTEISACQTVSTKYGRSVSLVKLVVADQTRLNFEIACWNAMAMLTQSLRAQDIIYFRGVDLLIFEIDLDLGLTEFRGVVSAGTRRLSRLTILYRCRRLAREDDSLRPRLDLEDQQTRLVRRLRDWIIKRDIVEDKPPALETQES